MKNLMLATTILALAGTNVQKAKAEDCGWATAGKILTGVVDGAVIASAIDAHASSSVTYSVPAYCPPPAPVVYAPPPRVLVTPPPVVYAPPPVVAYRVPVCAPPPAVVYRAPACVPRPVVAVKFGHRIHHRSGGHSHHHR